MEAVLTQSYDQKHIAIRESSQVAAARRAGNELSRALSFNETQGGRLAIVITEAATNILKHAGEGQILLRVIHEQTQSGMQCGIEVLAIDSGPGIVNLRSSLSDGISTSATSGTGLGAMSRLSSEFDAFTSVGKGSAFYMTIWAQPNFVPRQDVQFGVVCLPKPGEEISGDCFFLHSSGDRHMLIVADGLGHGPEANLASSSATALAAQHPEASPTQFIESAHKALRPTRGAAIAVATINGESLLFAGVGNIAASLGTVAGRRHLMSHNGIVGHTMSRVQEFPFAWTNSSCLIMHSDGLTTQWDLAQYPGLIHCHPALIAAVLYRDFFRKRDDVTVVVLSQPEFSESL